MLPMDLQASLGSTGAILVQLLIGFAFGFALESSGFADSRKLARQFYFQEMTVLKVMFGAILVAMLVVAWGAATGLVDFSRVFVNPTYWKSGMLGGLILGMGFIIGGFCPGTAWAGMATGKLDAVFFIGGVFIGVFAFGETVPRFWDFFNEGGVRLTLADWLGVPMYVVVLAITVAALGAFWASEKAEIAHGARWVQTKLEPTGPKRVAAVVLIILAGTLLLRGEPTLEKQLAWHAQAQDELLASRAVHADPAELLSLMHNNQMRLVLLDARSEGEFNHFHLKDARWLPAEAAEENWVRELDPETVIFVMSEREDRAEDLWRRLDAQGVKNLYLLSGGLEQWVALYAPQLESGTEFAHSISEHGIAGTEVSSGVAAEIPEGAALGDRVSLARPDLDQLAPREFTPVVVAPRPVSNLGGGCG